MEEANECLGFKPDQRDYGIGVQLLREPGVHSMRLPNLLTISQLRKLPSRRFLKANRERTDAKQQGQGKSLGMMVARDGIEPPTPAF